MAAEAAEAAEVAEGLEPVCNILFNQPETF